MEKNLNYSIAHKKMTDDGGDDCYAETYLYIIHVFYFFYPIRFANPKTAITTTMNIYFSLYTQTIIFEFIHQHPHNNSVL
ncbi:hypothetical protein HUG17_7702 [Dermatophagoides farinae]|uniref:Uncharacterized protein n=1 Tax=Dermatophagoides farinae TaxID=6954 RepID=A0A9D4NZ92_DERFA|nr:hypothetical protein HUG17_7702 [Dermatophagoides farinae]